MIDGLNHITLCVSDLNRSFNFYKDILGFTPKAKWDKGAYFTINEIWFCINIGNITQQDNKTHIAFDISNESFENMKSKLIQNNIKSWQENRSEGKSFYFLDPDNHKLEIHVGNLETRLSDLKLNPPNNIEWYD